MRSAKNKKSELHGDIPDHHWPIHDQKKIRSRCKMPSCGSFSSIYCLKCGNHLCLTRKRNCFMSFHIPTTKSKSTKKQQRNNKATHSIVKQTASIKVKKDATKKTGKKSTATSLRNCSPNTPTGSSPNNDMVQFLQMFGLTPTKPSGPTKPLV